MKWIEFVSMRILMPCCGFLEQTFSVWLVSVIVVSGATLGWCIASQTGASYPSIKVLLDMARDMVSLLGVIAAILISVIASMYALGEQKREAGYLPFLQALNGFRRLPDEIASSREAIDPGDSGSAYRWAELTMEFIVRMNEVRPSWGGYDADPKLEGVMLRYVEDSSEVKMVIAENLSDVSDGAPEILRLNMYEEESLRGMLIGLFAMDSGIVMKRFATSLVRLSISLAFVLLIALSVRTLVGLEDPPLFDLVAWGRPFAYLFFPITTIVHVLGIICAARVWRGRTQARETAWERE